MRLTMLKSKLHMGAVTDANLNYHGSISLGEELCQEANLRAFEKVEIYNCNNGARFSTYVILGKPNEICLNGAAARHVQPGDRVIIACYADFEESEIEDFKPTLVFLNESNEITDKTLGELKA